MALSFAAEVTNAMSAADDSDSVQTDVKAAINTAEAALTTAFGNWKGSAGVGAQVTNMMRERLIDLARELGNELRV